MYSPMLHQLKAETAYDNEHQKTASAETDLTSKSTRKHSKKSNNPKKLCEQEPIIDQQIMNENNNNLSIIKEQAELKLSVPLSR